VAEFFAVMLRSEPHDAPWPGLERIRRDATGFCNREFERATGVAGEITSLDILVFRPDEASWADGDREIACFVRYEESINEEIAAPDPTRGFGLVSTFALEEGDCIADESLIAEVAVAQVDCADVHWFEVFASATIPTVGSLVPMPCSRSQMRRVTPRSSPLSVCPERHRRLWSSGFSPRPRAGTRGATGSSAVR
jgi:hypothetical protein